nr:uncharacterized protein LOC112543793 [Pelodiscus sinensis]|eukprot:XP_025034529.1 uncharacterized protein LOC112543793 [Pelodiscus sinensis]
MKTEKHQKNLKSTKQTSKVTDFMKPGPSSIHSAQIAAAELKLCGFIAEHNLPIALLDHLPGLVANVCPDSKIAKDIKCAKTKGTYIFSNVISEHDFSNLVSKLKVTKFSLIIDDISTIKQLVLVARHYDTEVQKTVDKFLTLEIKDTTALGIYNCIEVFLNSNEISFENLIGFASDNATVMMGSKGGVQHLLKQKISHIFIQPCVCHSLYLCAPKACTALPHYLEELARNIFSYLSNSPKRLNEYKEFQKFTNTNPQKNIHISYTRWLSLEQAVKRILEQWPALLMFFTSAALEDGIPMASRILEGLQNPITKMYYAFLAYILPDINKLNLEYQAETFRIHKLRNSINTSVKGILSNFIKRENLKPNGISKININDPSTYLRIDDIYCGATVESIYLDNSRKISRKEL